MEVVAKTHARNLVQWAKERENVVVLSADLTGSTEIAEFQAAYPGRFYSMGVAEQNMVSFAGGLAREGFLPFIHTFAVFIYRQALNQVVCSVAYSNLPVKFFGFLPGITTPGGATHQAIEDIGVMRAIPNMTIFETGDATEIETILDAVAAVPGPVYVRMLRGEVPRLFPKSEPFVPNRARVLGEGSDVTLVTAGICTEEALRATAALESKGVSIEHLHISTHKPFTDPLVAEALAKPKYGVITMENHTIIGGLGTEVAETIAERGIGKRLMRIGLNDSFAHGGSRAYLAHTYGLDAGALVARVEEMIGESLGIGEEELGAVRIEAVHSLAKAEGL